MKKVLIINGHQYYDVVAKGELTDAIITRANEFLKTNGFEVENTKIESDYDKELESKKLADADYVILQYPVYWMGVPWITKKYFDEVLTQNVHYASDGRSRNDPSKTYGSGGVYSVENICYH